MAKKSTKTVQTVAQKFANIRHTLSQSLIERESEVDLVLTALLCGEHVLFVGSPGTAKSMLIDSLMEWVGSGCQSFSRLLSKMTKEEEVFGPVSVTQYKQDKFRRITTNKLPEAHFAFLDEIFKSSSAILNTLLKVLNERVYENGDLLVECPLQVCMAASNEWPNQEEELGALFDRFLFRKTVQQVSPAGLIRLLKTENLHPEITEHISLDEIAQAREEAATLEFNDRAWSVMFEIIEQLKASGIIVGDRRMRKGVAAVKAYAYLQGASEVQPVHLEVLQHVFWSDPTEQPATAAKIIVKLANPESFKVNELLAQAVDVMNTNTPADAMPKMQEILKQIKSLSSEASKVAELYLQQEITRIYNKVIGL